MHVELLHYWLQSLGEGLRFEVRTVPPPRMAEAAADGQIDVFCVGEPWGSVAAETGAAQLVLPGRGDLALRAGEGAGGAA